MADCQVCAHFYVHYEWPKMLIENDGSPVLWPDGPNEGKQKQWGTTTHCTVDHRTWSAGNDGHCETCHEHFRGIAAFTNHRRSGGCRTREELLANEPTESGRTFFLDDRDIWHYGIPGQTYTGPAEDGGDS